MNNTNEKKHPQWRVWMQLTWQWLKGGPRLVAKLGSAYLAAQRAQQAAEVQARDDRRDVFKNWSLVCAASDGTIIRIRPGTMTLHVQGPMNDAVHTRIKQAWKDSSLLIRLPMPVTAAGAGFQVVGDWKLAPYSITEL